MIKDGVCLPRCMAGELRARHCGHGLWKHRKHFIPLLQDSGQILYTVASTAADVPDKWEVNGYDDPNDYCDFCCTLHPVSPVILHSAVWQSILWKQTVSLHDQLCAANRCTDWLLFFCPPFLNLRSQTYSWLWHTGETQQPFWDLLSSLEKLSFSQKRLSRALTENEQQQKQHTQKHCLPPHHHFPTSGEEMAQLDS